MLYRIMLDSKIPNWTARSYTQTKWQETISQSFKFVLTCHVLDTQQAKFTEKRAEQS